jgi:thiamine biosynthesis lipoprotein
MNRVAVPLHLTRDRCRPRAGRLVRLSGPTMGVTWTVSAVAPPDLAETVIRAAAQQAANAVVAEMSDWEVDSDLSRFNRAAPGWVAVPDGLMTVVRAGLDLARDSDGAFDPTLGALVDLWGFGPSGPRKAAPDQGALRSAGAGWRALGVDVEGGRLHQPGGLAQDLSGIAKGYGVDRLALALEALGGRDYLVEVGGELRGAGVKPDGEPWFVEIERPPGLACNEPPILVALHDLSIATSGEWRRGRLQEGRRIGHTIDPASRVPIRGPVASVTVLHAQCMQADALCTALAVMGADAGLAFAEARGLAALYMQEAGGRLEERMTSAFAAMLQ